MLNKFSILSSPTYRVALIHIFQDILIQRIQKKNSFELQVLKTYYTNAMCSCCSMSTINYYRWSTFYHSNEFHYIPRIESLIKAILIALRDSLARFLFYVLWRFVCILSHYISDYF